MNDMNKSTPYLIVTWPNTVYKQTLDIVNTCSFEQHFTATF